MNNHLFILTPGTWLGEGKICLNKLAEELFFFTRWTVGMKEANLLECKQEIQIKGMADIMVNHFCFSDFLPGSFSVLMENHAVGKVTGKGLIDPARIGWEFRVKEIGFEGFEFYEKQNEELYHVHGEFSTHDGEDDLRTVVRGKIWRKMEGSV